jgi:uncharacterized Zn-finger protein
MDEQTIVTANEQPHYSVHQNELPICCPRPEMSSWNAHPRVYLDLESKKSATCPYCGTVFHLVDAI